MLRSSRIRIALAAALLFGAGLRGGIPPIVDDWRRLSTGASDLVRLEADRYRPLIASLPERGVVGYLQPDDWPSPDAQRRFYLAEYSLTPRIVVMGTVPDHVIVVPEASMQGDEAGRVSSGDPRLADFILLRRFDNGLRVFRRIR